MLKGEKSYVRESLPKKNEITPDFSPRLDALSELPEGRGFSPAEIGAPAFCWSLAPRSPAGAGLRGARDTAIIKKAL